MLRGNYNIYQHLWQHSDFLNMWTPDVFQQVTNFILEYPSLIETQLEFHLTHGSNMFLALPNKLSFITHLYQTLQ